MKESTFMIRLTEAFKGNEYIIIKLNMDEMLKASLDWINTIAFPDTGFDHPNDENKVKCAARALDKMGVVIDKNEVIDYCNELGMPQESIDKIVDWYSRSKGLHIKYEMTFSTKDLKEIWSRKLE